MARRGSSVRSVDAGTLVVYNGSQWTAYDGVTRSDVNTLRYADGEVSIDAVTVVRPGLYVLCAGEIALLSETDFHAARRRVIFASLFQNTTDIMEFAKQAAIFVVLAVSLLSWFNLQSVSGAVAHLQTLLPAVGK